MQIIRLVEAGRVDKIIGFNELPERLLKGVLLNDIAGLPRHWRETAKVVEERIQVSKEPDTFETRKKWCHYILEYKDINKDKDTWQEITNFAKKACDLTQRLTDKVEDMAINMAPDSHQPLNIEPEDIPVVNIPIQYQEKIVAPSGEPIASIKEEPQEEPKQETKVEVAPALAPVPEMIKIEVPAPEVKTPRLSGPWDCPVCGKHFEDGRGRRGHDRTHATLVPA